MSTPAPGAGAEAPGGEAPGGLEALNDQLLRRLDTLEQRLGEKFERRLERASLAVMRQLEAFLQLHACLGPIPAPLHGWAISADLALLLLRQVEAAPPDLVLEFGSGVSTWVLLSALARVGSGAAKGDRARADQASAPSQGPRLLSFEHRGDCRDATADLLRASPLRQRLDLRLAPLEPWSEGDRSYSFYGSLAAIGAALAPLRSSNRPQRLLVLVDGPPGRSGPLARYPALPALLEQLQGDAGSGPPLQVDLFLDDLERREERQIANLWEQRLQAEGLACQRREPVTENGTLHLRWQTRL
ncbi:MAG: hypothetical protein ACK550_06260 [Synechococcaceae cyanobacterium]